MRFEFLFPVSVNRGGLMCCDVQYKIVFHNSDLSIKSIADIDTVDVVINGV